MAAFSSDLVRGAAPAIEASAVVAAPPKRTELMVDLTDIEVDPIRGLPPKAWAARKV
jgi:hypothetical protein